MFSKQANSEQKRLNALVLSLTNQLNEALHNLQELQRENEDLKASARISKKHVLAGPDGDSIEIRSNNRTFNILPLAD